MKEVTIQLNVGLMKLLEQDSNKDCFQKIVKNIIPLLGIIFFFFVTISCENDIEKIKSLTIEEDLPIQSGKDIEILYTDSGYLKLKIITPELKKFAKKEDIYYEFPKGIKAIIYTKDLQEKAFIESNYAIYYDKLQLWEARKNVRAIDNLEKKELYTETLYWDQKAKKVYSKSFTKIITPNGIFYGQNGFEAEENLSKYRLFGGSSGSINVEEENYE